MAPHRDELGHLVTVAQELDLGKAPKVHRDKTVVDGYRVSALRWHPEDVEMVALHGAALNAHTWDATLLASGLPTLALDLPGHGESEWREDGDYRAQVIAPTVAGAIDRLLPPQGTKPLLVGHSLGGLTAAIIAARNPERWRGLAIIDILPREGENPGASYLEEFFSRKREFETLQEAVDYAGSFGLGGDPVQLRRGVKLNTRLNAAGKIVWKHHLGNMEHLNLFRAGSAEIWPALEQLAAAALPIVLVRAENGIVSDEEVTEFTARVPQGIVLTLGTGHNVQEEDPVALAELLRELANETA